MYTLYIVLRILNQYTYHNSHCIVKSRKKTRCTQNMRERIRGWRSHLAAARHTRTRTSSAPQHLDHWPWNLPRWMNTPMRWYKLLVERCWSVTDALLNRSWSVSEAHDYYIGLVGLFALARLKLVFYPILKFLVEDAEAMRPLYPHVLGTPSLKIYIPDLHHRGGAQPSQLVAKI